MDAPFEVSGEVAASPLRVFEAFLDAEIHGAMTGGAATVAEDGSFTAWGGYISGRTIEAVPGEKLVQAWRTSQFPESDPDSVLEIHFEAVAGGTLVTFRHRDLPDGQGPDYAQGWVDHYLEPMDAYFDSVSS